METKKVLTGIKYGFSIIVAIVLICLMVTQHPKNDPDCFNASTTVAGVTVTGYKTSGSIENSNDFSVLIKVEYRLSNRVMDQFELSANQHREIRYVDPYKSYRIYTLDQDSLGTVVPEKNG